MGAAMLTAVTAMVTAVLTAGAALYGHRGANRAAQEGGALTGFNHLTDQLQEELKEKRTDVSTLRADLAAERAENARLRLLVTRLGGTP